jgi:hypothetical protein
MQEALRLAICQDSWPTLDVTSPVTCSAGFKILVGHWGLVVASYHDTWAILDEGRPTCDYAIVCPSPCFYRGS